MRLILKPDWDPNNPYHYHVNGQKVVVTPEDWEKYKDDPTFREVRAAVEAEQAAHPEPEYDEVENPAWRTAYRRIGLSLPNYWNGKEYVQSPLPEGYSRDSRGVAKDANGNYYAPVKDMSYCNPNVPFFVNNERSSFNGNTVPVRYEQVQMPERTIRQLRQPLPVDRVINVNIEKDRSISDYQNNNKVFTLEDIFDIDNAGHSKGWVPLPLGSKLDWNNIYDGDNLNLFSDAFTKIFGRNIKVKDLGRESYDAKFVVNLSEEEVNTLRKEIQKRTGREFHTKPMPIQPSRKEAEKKAVISIGDLEKVGTFAEGGSIDDPPDKKPAITVGGYVPDYYPSQQEWLRNWFGNREEQIKDNFKGITLGVNGFDPSRSIPVQYVERAIDGSMKVPVKYKSLNNDPDNPTSAYIRKTKQIYIDPNMPDIGSFMLHERIHALNHHLIREVGGQQGYKYSPIESKVYNVMMPWYKGNELDVDEYWDNPKEIYARMMQMRYRLNLDPTKKVTKEDLNKWRKNGLLKQYEMGLYDDDTLLRLFNDVAENNQLEEINYSKHGNKLIRRYEKVN